MEKTYCNTYKKGYLGDFTTEWWTEEDWKRHREYVEELKEKGEYGKEEEHCLTLTYCPELDDGIDWKDKKSTPQLIIFDTHGTP